MQTCGEERTGGSESAPECAVRVSSKKFLTVRSLEVGRNINFQYRNVKDDEDVTRTN